MNIKKVFILLLLVMPAVSLAYEGKEDMVYVLPGKGIIFNGDSILISKTTVADLKKVLKITKEPVLMVSDWGESDASAASSFSVEEEFSKEILYKDMLFGFTGTDSLDFKLNWILIEYGNELKVKIKDSLFLGDLNPDIDRFFTKTNKYDYISPDLKTYNLYSLGISLKMETVENDKVLNEVSVHYVISEGN